jgi:hypothetical protein
MVWREGLNVGKWNQVGTSVVQFVFYASRVSCSSFVPGTGVSEQQDYNLTLGGTWHLIQHNMAWHGKRQAWRQ